MTRLANGFVAVVALGGCLALLMVAVVAGSGPGTVAATVLLGLFAWVAKSHIANVRNVKAQIAARRGGRPLAPVPAPAIASGSIRDQLAARRAPVIEPVPVPSQLAAAPMAQMPPHSCAVEVLRDYFWHDPQFGLMAKREIVRVAEGVLSPSAAAEVVRELNAAHQVVRREIAS